MGSKYPHKEISGLGNAVRVARAAGSVLYEEKKNTIGYTD